MNYTEFFKFLENKDHFIDKIVNLTPEQKTEIKSFFAKHPNYENKIDWNKINTLTYKDFEPILALEGKSMSQAKKNGISGLVQNYDYAHLASGNGWDAYQPLTYYASRILASKAVAPAIEGKWCVAYQKDRSYWDDYSIEKEESFVFLFGDAVPSKKLALELTCNRRKAYNFLHGLENTAPGYHSNDFFYLNIWDAEDSNNAVDLSDIRYYLNISDKELSQVFQKAVDNHRLVKQMHEADINKSKEIEKQQLEITVKKLMSEATFDEVTKRYDFNCAIDNDVAGYFVKDGKFTISFGTVNGSFNCESLDLISFENGPVTVLGNFLGSGNKITSFEGAPKHVEGIFHCNNNRYLKSLKGMPEFIGGDIYLINSDVLESLEGCIETVLGDFNIQFCKNLKSLKYGPKAIQGSYNCHNCTSLTSLEGAPSAVKQGSFLCYGCDLTSLEGAPKHVRLTFDCGNNKRLESLKGAPSIVRFNFMVNDCKSLKTLEGCPSQIGGRFSCNGCDSLESYDFLPKAKKYMLGYMNIPKPDWYDEDDYYF